jgi:hypothetical protein
VGRSFSHDDKMIDLISMKAVMILIMAWVEGVILMLIIASIFVSDELLES